MYGQNSRTGDDQGAAQSKSIQRNELQREIVMQESDWHKKEAEKIMVVSEIRALKKEQDRLKVEMQARQTKLQRLEQEVSMMDMSIKDLKKKLNLI